MPTKCIVKGCKNLATSKGYCPKHYQRLIRFGSTDLPKKEEKICNIDGCGGKVVAKGLCSKHYKMIKREEKREKIKKEKISNILKNNCKVNGCNGEEYRRGYCTKHYQRTRKHGSPITDSGLYKEMSTRERLLLKMYVSPDSGCWEWEGYTNRYGYGVFSIDNYPKPAHIASYESFVGSIPEGLCVCHKCDNRSCINPTHLFLATSEENNADRDSKGRVLKGEDSGTAILTESEVVKIKKLLKKGELTNAEIGRKFGVTSWAISRIKCGKNWKQVEI